MSRLPRLLINFLSRLVAKVFLFLALSVSTPTVNAMRFLEESKAVVIVMESASFRRRERGIGRRLGRQPAVQFVQFDIANYGI